MRVSRLIALFAVGILLFGCATSPRDPEPTIAGDLTVRDIETVIADAMMVTASHLLLLLSDERIDQPEGVIVKESSTFRWSATDMRNTVGTIDLELDDYRLQSDLFSGEYRGYAFTGAVTMVLKGDAADLKMDLRTAHRQPEKYPVTRLELELSNLEDEIVPDHVNGYIVANGYDVDVAAVVRARQIGN